MEGQPVAPRWTTRERAALAVCRVVPRPARERRGGRGGGGGERGRERNKLHVLYVYMV